MDGFVTPPTNLPPRLYSFLTLFPFRAHSGKKDAQFGNSRFGKVPPGFQGSGPDRISYAKQHFADVKQVALPLSGAVDSITVIKSV